MVKSWISKDKYDLVNRTAQKSTGPGQGNGGMGDHATGGEAVQGMERGSGHYRPRHCFSPGSDEKSVMDFKEGTTTRVLCFERLFGAFARYFYFVLWFLFVSRTVWKAPFNLEGGFMFFFPNNPCLHSGTGLIWNLSAKSSQRLLPLLFRLKGWRSHPFTAMGSGADGKRNISMLPLPAM